MRNLLRCRRGSVAFATVIALVPLIGFVALGAEAGSWYVTKQQAQNAADAAAYSGAVKLECDIAAQTGVPCTDASSVDYRGKQFAAKNAFCNRDDTQVYDAIPYPECNTKLPKATSQTVQIASLTSWKGVPGNFVQATVSQQQPAYLTAVLGFSTINIPPATAVAQVNSLQNPPCILALTGSVSFQGSPTVSSPTCGVASNSSAPDAIGFKGNNGLQIDAPSYTVGGCSQTGGNQCDNVKTYAAKIPDPLSALNSAMSSLKTSDFSGPCVGTTPIAYTATTRCYNTTSSGSLSGTLTGTYFFSGTVSLPGGNGSVTTGVGGATLILFGSGATLSNVSGNPTITLTAQTSVDSTTVPQALSSAPILGLMKDLLIYDPSSSAVKLTGNPSSYYNGTIYAPKAAVTYGGNTSVGTSGCFQLIAASVKFSGDTKLDNTKCNSDSAPTPNALYVQLIQ